jgi:hypothetical protein
LRSRGHTIKRTQSASAQLGQGKHAPKLPSAGIITEVSRPLAKRVVDEMSDRDSEFVLQTEEPARPSSQSLSGFSSRTISQPAPTTKNNRRGPQNIMIPKIKLIPPDDPATVLGQRNKAVTVSSPAPDSRADRSTSIDPSSTRLLLHPLRSRPSGLHKVRQHKVMADEAHQALHTVIGYCKQQPTGFLNIEEGVVLGKLDERLRCFFD